MYDRKPPIPMTPESTRDHLSTLVDDDFGVFERRGDWPGYVGRPLMLRDGDTHTPLVQSGVHDGHVFVETWESYERRLEESDT